MESEQQVHVELEMEVSKFFSGPTARDSILSWYILGSARLWITKSSEWKNIKGKIDHKLNEMNEHCSSW